MNDNENEMLGDGPQYIVKDVSLEDLQQAAAELRNKLPLAGIVPSMDIALAMFAYALGFMKHDAGMDVTQVAQLADLFWQGIDAPVSKLQKGD